MKDQAVEVDIQWFSGTHMEVSVQLDMDVQYVHICVDQS
jgi:hypothetical protein